MSCVLLLSQRSQIRKFIKYEFELGHSATEDPKNICYAKDEETGWVLWHFNHRKFFITQALFIPILHIGLV